MALAQGGLMAAQRLPRVSRGVSGVPLLFLVEWPWGVGAIALGYLLQWIGHRVEGNDVGEFIPVKKLLGLPYVAIAPNKH